VWVQDGVNGQIFKIDPRTGTKVGSLGLTNYPASLAARGNTVWAGLSMIDARTNLITYRNASGAGCCVAIVLDRGSLWALGGSSVRQVEPFTGHLRRTFDISGGSALAVGQGNVWVLDRIQGRVIPISSASGRVGQSIALPGDPSAVAVGGGALWIADREGTVDRIPIGGTGGVESVRLGGDPVDVAFGAGAVWVADCKRGTVDRIDPLTARVQKTIHLGGSPTDLAIGQGGVWALIAPIPADGCP
jgi:hypothetical protein